MIIDVHAHYFPKEYKGADHLVAGSDYPVLLAFETYRQTFHYIRESSLPAEDVDKILNHNAQILLGLEH